MQLGRHADVGERRPDRRDVAVLRPAPALGEAVADERRDRVDHLRRGLAVPVDQRLPEVEDHRAHERSTSHERRTSVLGRPRVADREADHRPRRAAASRRRRASPVAVAARASSKLSPSACRKQTVENGCGAVTSQPGSASTQRGEELREPHVLADQRAQALGAVPAQHEPELQRAEAAAERRPVVLQVDRVVGRGEVVARRARTSSWSTSGRRVQNAEQSIGVKSHLCGLTTIESARSHPSRHQRSSGQTAAEPAYAASTCSQTPASSQRRGELGHRVDRRRPGRADGRDDRGRVVEREVGAHPERVVDLDLAGTRGRRAAPPSRR